MPNQWQIYAKVGGRFMPDSGLRVVSRRAQERPGVLCLPCFGLD